MNTCLLINKNLRWKQDNFSKGTESARWSTTKCNFPWSSWKESRNFKYLILSCHLNFAEVGLENH